jgi:hypothetical protein
VAALIKVYASMSTNGNYIDFDNLPDAEKLNFIQNAVQKLPVDDRAKLVKSLLGTLQSNSKLDIFNTYFHLISLMNKAEMGNLIEAIASLAAGIAQKLKGSN